MEANRGEGDKVLATLNASKGGHAKDLVTELAHPHAESAWGSREERVRAVGLVPCCNYFSKKKKESKGGHRNT